MTAEMLFVAWAMSTPLAAGGAVMLVDEMHTPTLVEPNPPDGARWTAAVLGALWPVTVAAGMLFVTVAAVVVAVSAARGDAR